MTEPPACVPNANEQKPAATAAADPLLDPLCLASTPHMNEQMTAGSHL
nr:hypothetical protein [Ktedonobacter sp. SOSP1-85]